LRLEAIAADTEKHRGSRSSKKAITDLEHRDRANLESAQTRRAIDKKAEDLIDEMARMDQCGIDSRRVLNDLSKEDPIPVIVLCQQNNVRKKGSNEYEQRDRSQCVVTVVS
jgi:hypothetical protein